jgi:acetylornithine deacetylase/succinyl-diaminopimelate desuccinylase-like protein
VALVNETVELLQALIRNECTNDGTAESGHETRNTDTLEQYLDGVGLAFERFERTAGRRSIVTRIEGSDPSAPSLMLMGHTDVVTADPSGWRHDPFGGELIDDEVWGRGAVDMLNLTSSMAVAFRHLATSGFRPRGDLIYYAVADEESGSAHGARWMADNHAEAIRADYVLTENGGLHAGSPEAPVVGINIGEKGVAWRRIRIHGAPGHGSMPFRKDNALITASRVVERLAAYRPPPRFPELWRERVDSLQLGDTLTAALLNDQRLDETLEEMDNLGLASNLYSFSHTTFSCNVVRGGSDMKTNIIPGTIDLDVDIRTLPGEDADSVSKHLAAALGDLYADVDIEILMNDTASISPTTTPLWDSLARAVGKPFENARLSPQMTVGFTDARIFRELGSVAYGAGLFSPNLDPGEYSSRFHGHNERIDVESLRLTTNLWLDVARDFLS